MKQIAHWVPLHRSLPLVTFLAAACSGTAPPSGGSLEQERPGATAVVRGGLDAPAIAVGPFLDGTLPPRTPNSPGSSQWTTVPAFPNLDVTNTIVISSNPGDDRIYVGSQDGLIVAFDNRADVSTSETFLDLRDRVAVVNEGGLFGLAFHPQFGEIGSPYQKSFYLYYSSHCPLDSSRDAADLSACDDSYPTDRVNGFFNVYLRLSRFEVYEGTTTGNPSSEQVLLNFRLYGPRHRGGGLAIRRDGYLYLAIGDQDRPESAQEIVGNFDGGTLRVALNTIDNGDGTWTCPVGSHQPRRTFDTVDETSGRYYCIPDSNPWLDPAGGLLEEYCAIGLRNPFRLGIDPVTDRVWVGDVGQSSREEVNVIECGNNYGWPFREGTIEGVRTEPSSYLGVLTDPVVEFTRSEATSIIGGYVYRGTRFPELYGRYLAGDYGTDGIWAITLDESTMTGSKTYLTDFAAGNLVTWGQDNAGEVFLGDIYGTGLIYALDRVGTPAPDAPSLLSETGALSNLAAAAPSGYWVPYAPNQPFWSDGASKSRFIALPTDGTRDTAAEQIGFSATGDWTFPSGTVLMKQFELPLDEADPSVTTRLETRFMVLGDDDKWYGLTYRWRADQLEADLLTTDETASYTIRRADGGTRMQNWYFPSRLDCLSCHRQGSGGALGLKTHQLNGDFTYPSTGRTDNQIRTWNDLGMFSPPVSDTVIPTLLSAPAFADVAAPLQDRARSWLDANCSYCHRPGEVNAGFDARFTTSFADQGFLWTAVRDDLGNPGTVVIYPGDAILSAAWQRSAAVGPIAMPPLAKALPDQPAVDLLAEWIERLPSAEPNSPPALANPGDQNNGPGDAVALSLIATDDDGDALYFDAIGLPDGLSLNHDAGVISGTVGSAGTQTVTVSASDGPSVSVVSFEWRVAADTCGDGALNTGEQCDDGNLANGDGCTSSCMLEFCGDGLVNNGGTEACEPPGTATCTDDCAVRTPSCGDGFLTPPEECEDGNTANGDGCSSACTIEAPPECGDGNTDLGEECDDGNQLDGDGCTSGCVLEVCGDGVVNNNGTEACEPPGTALCTDACQVRSALCGDGFLTPPEQCEDGNVGNGDGCTSGCVLEVCGDGVVNNNGTEACEPPNTALCRSDCQVRTPLCGDGFLTPPEECEDGNTASGDGCSSACTIEVPPECGDGNADLGEECDDGNQLDGDGCTSGCVLEVCGDGVVNNGGTEACEPPGTALCTDACQVRSALCGDGYQTPPEQCEDGNTLNGDGCTSSCVLELCGDGVVNNGGTEACEPPGTALCTDACQVRSALCGDGFLTPPEQCEDGNLLNGDGCTSSCALEVCGDGVVNNNGAEACEPPNTALCGSDCQIRTPLCGDGFLTPPEQCEDGNLLNGDGCTSSCALEVCGDGVVNNNGAEACEPPNTALCGSDCQIRTPLCGDGFLTPPEQCEDGNLLNGDGCTSSCGLELCGDGVVNNGGTEACEPPGTALCTDACQVRSALCGDGFLTPPEQCDDGGLTNGDGCSSTCAVEVPPACGDGSTDPGEECDDGNLISGDGCTASCALELCGDGVINGDGAEACEPPDTALCTSDCQIRAPLCGDGYQTPPEQCEDGNVLDGDGCTSSCVLELCGDGVVNNNGAESCEPPGTASCTDTCGIRAPLCGDGFLTAPEQCDDGNLADGDGCTASCMPEVCGDGIVNNGGTESCEPPGTAVCSVNCIARSPLCGDGFLTAPEQCDDGNLVSGDGCTLACVREYCGDGVVNDDGAEACEPPSTGLCTDLCMVRDPVCGDGHRTPPEQCEDGNTLDGDGCTSRCMLELCGDGVVNNGGSEDCEPPGTASCNDVCEIRIPLCGDGFVTPPEECDDGDQAEGDGCSSICKLEPLTEPDGGVPMPDGGVPMPDGGMPMPDGGMLIPDGGALPEPDSGTSAPEPNTTSGDITVGCSARRNGSPIDAGVLLGLLGLVLARRRRLTAL